MHPYACIYVGAAVPPLLSYSPEIDSGYAHSGGLRNALRFSSAYRGRERSAPRRRHRMRITVYVLVELFCLFRPQRATLPPRRNSRGSRAP